MNEIILNNNTMPIVSSFDFCIAPEPFLHADRITDFNILIYVIEGTIYVTEDDIDYEIHTGELFFLKNGVHHFGKKIIAKGTKWYYAHFYLPEPTTSFLFNSDSAPPSHTTSVEMNYFAMLPKHLTALNGTSIEETIFNFKNTTHILHSPPISTSNSNVTQRTLNLLNTSPNPTTWMIHAQFFNLLSQIAFYHSPKSSVITLADRICNYLHTHYNKPFSATELEQYFFLSYKHMAAIFKQEKQITMQQYHTQVRMNIACKLLRTTLDSVGQISESLGYNDMLYFSRCFHQFIGMSPTAYRKMQISQY